MRGLLRSALERALALLERRLFGLTRDEIRYTFEDVRAEIRATRAELLDEIAALRAEIDRLAGRPPASEDDASHPEA